MPAEKETALVLSATALPQATGQASRGLSCAGARCTAFATIDSSRFEARSKRDHSSITKSNEEQIVAPGNERKNSPGGVPCAERSLGPARNISSGRIRPL